MEWPTVQTLIRLHSDLGLHCLPRPDCLKTAVWSGSTLFAKSWLSENCSLIWVYTVCPDLTVWKLRSELGLHCLPSPDFLKSAVWCGSTLFAQTWLSENCSLRWVYTVCPVLTVWKLQSDAGLHCLPRPDCLKTAVWSGSALFAQTWLSENCSLIWVYTVCLDPTVWKLQSDLGLHCLPRPDCLKTAVWSGSTLFAQAWLSENCSQIWVFTVCPGLTVWKLQSDLGPHCLPRCGCLKTAVWSGSTLFAQTWLSENLGWLW